MTRPSLINNRYRLLDKIGQGGMGTVFKATDRLEQREVALKQVSLTPAELAFASKPSSKDTDRLRYGLAREFQILAGLRHPYIVSVLDYGFDERRVPYFTMDYIPQAQTITDYAAPLPEDERVPLLIHTLEALAYLHRRGVIHRDLKPDNILITAEGRVQVMDFGISRSEQAQSDNTGEGTISGTFAYMAPELYQDGTPSVASDLYAVGVVAYQMLVGQMPYPRGNIATTIASILTKVPDTSMLDNPQLEAWLQRLLGKDPSDRYLDAHSTIVALCEAIDIPVPPESQQVRESYLQASTFVGRDAELKQLTSALDQLESTSAFFLVGGESGVGKSRLLDELRTEALVKGVRVLRGQAAEGGGLPFQVWRSIVRRMMLLADLTDLQAGILKDIVPDIDGLLGRKIPNAPELTGSAYQDRVVLTIVDLFRDASQPLVLLLEDLQWTDESLAVLEQILKVSEQLPQVMVVATYRDDEAPDLPKKLTGMTHIMLDRLAADAVSELSRAMLGDVGLNEKVVKLLHSQSEGNVFFLVETVRALAEESGNLRRIGEGELPEDVFTGGMQAITRRRLSKVDAQYAEMQRLAAVIGREIDEELLAHVYDEAMVEAWLANAAEYGVVSIQENTWRFDHDKLREAVVADVPDDVLPALHRTAAETIEAVYPADASYNEALLAHWQVTDDVDKVYKYLLPVSEKMIMIAGAYARAEALLHDMLRRLADGDQRCIALHDWLAMSAFQQGAYERCRNHATQAQALATTHGDQLGLANSLFQLGIIATTQSDYQQATTLCQQSLAIYRQLGNQDGIAQTLNNLGVIAFYQGDPNHASDLYQQSLAIYRQLGDQPGIAQTLNNLGNIAMEQGDYERASQLHQESLAIRQQVSNQHGIAMSLINLGIIARDQGKYARATDLFQQSVAIRQELGDQHGIALSLSNIGWLMLKQHNLEAVNPLCEGLAISSQLNIPWLSIYFIVSLSGILIYKGHAERAAELLSFVEAHSLKKQDLQQRIDELMPQVKTALPPDELQAALDRGKELDLDAVVDALLTEFGEEA